MRAVRHAAGQKHHELTVCRAQDRHRGRLAPHLRRLRAEPLTLDGQRLIDAIDRGTQDDEFLLDRCNLERRQQFLLGVRERGAHENEHDRR
jgi:hypothetical protein